MKILGVECTASPVSVALLEDGILKAEYFLNQKITHSQTLLPMCESLLKLSDVSINEVDAFAVTAGPGSFTGVRIGISAVKGLAQPLDKPCVPVSVLEAMAYSFIGNDCIVCATMDARCKQVYNALFKVEGETVTRLCDDRALMIDELCDDLKKINDKSPDEKVIVVGDGANLFYNTAKEQLSFIELAPEHLKLQRASGVCFVAQQLFDEGVTVSADKLLPVYLRLPQAERELKAKNNK